MNVFTHVVWDSRSVELPTKNVTVIRELAWIPLGLGLSLSRLKEVLSLSFTEGYQGINKKFDRVRGQFGRMR